MDFTQIVDFFTFSKSVLLTNLLLRYLSIQIKYESHNDWSKDLFMIIDRF
jgi:hypothetical protein